MEERDNCPNCGAEIEHQSYSMHVWSIEYACGYTIWGAVDVRTHGRSIEVSKPCLNKKDEYNND